MYQDWSIPRGPPIITEEIIRPENNNPRRNKPTIKHTTKLVTQIRNELEGTSILGHQLDHLHKAYKSIRFINPRLHRLIIHFNHKDHKSNSTGCKTSNFKTLFQLNWWRIKSLVATTSMARNAIEVLI